MVVIHKDKDITAFVSSMSWGGSKSEVARKLELKIVNAPLDPNFATPVIDLADPVYLFEDDCETERFRGFIVDREFNSAQGTITYVAYDLLFYTLKSTATYNFSSKTAETIAQVVCDDMEIPVGSLASTGIPQKLIVQNVSLYEIIMQAYTQAHQQNGVSYCVIAKKGLLNVEEMGKVIGELELTEDTNILSSQCKETLANMVNRVRIYDGEGNPIGVAQQNGDIKRYGVFQQTYVKEEGKDAKTIAKSMLNGVDRTYTFNCINHNDVITGTGIVIADNSVGLDGIVWVEADTHTWENGVATMSLTVTLKQIMDTRESTNGSQIEETSTSSNTSNKTIVYGSKTNPPYQVANSYWRAEKSGISSYAEAFNYYSANNGSSKGWKILDSDRREVQI